PDLIDELKTKLRAFASAGQQAADEQRQFYDFVRAPSRRGQGSPTQRIYRDAIAHALATLIDHHGGRFSRAHQDEIISILASVAFPEFEIDATTVKRDRERHQRKTQRRDN